MKLKSLSNILKEADVSGLETGQEPEPPDEISVSDDEIPRQKQKSSETEYVSKSLSGQTIESADVILKNGNAEIELRITGSKLPVRFVFEKSGKLIFWYKNRSTVLSKK